MDYKSSKYSNNQQNSYNVCWFRDTFAKWESKGFSNDKIRPSSTANNRFSLKLTWMNNSRITVELEASCLKKTK